MVTKVARSRNSRPGGSGLYSGRVQPGEKQLAAYAAQQGLDGHDDHEPDLGGAPGKPQPDFRLSRGGSAAIIEVKEYESSVLHDRMQDGGFSPLAIRTNSDKRATR